MAKLNNEFLVFHLRDICALYITQQKLSARMDSLSDSIERLKRGRRNPLPIYPVGEPLFTAGRVISLLFGIGWTLFFLLSYILYFKDLFEDKFLFLTSLFSTGIGIAAIILPIKYIRDTIQNNNAEFENYQDQYKIYEQTKAEDEQRRKLIPSLQVELSNASVAYKKVSNLLTKAYSINIIPNQYRTRYVAVYLYKYFEGSHEDDLTMAINTFVLEEIKERLDRFIANQSEALFNQYAILSNQENARIERQRNHEQLMNKLDSIEASNEQRNAYLRGMKNSADIALFYATIDFYDLK